METRANFILIGLFTILGIFGALGFFIWLASVQIDRQYAQYGVLFENVSGLNPSGDVLFNGVGVGQVTGIRIWENDPSYVYVDVEIDAATPIRVDTVAQLKSQGVTGVAYIELSGGSPDAAPLAGIDGATPIITSRRSTVQALVEDAPDILTSATEILSQLRAMTGPENQAHVNNILSNLDASSSQLDAALSDFSEITTTVREATAQITLFTERLDGIGASVQTTLGAADSTLESATSAFDEAQRVLGSTNKAIENAEDAFAATQELMRTDVPAIVAQISETATKFDTVLGDLTARAGTVIDGFGDTATLANERLRELDQTLADASEAFAAVTTASDNLDHLVTGDGATLVADAKAAVQSLNQIVRDDVPAIVADIREGVETANVAIDRIATDLTGATQGLDPLIAEATATFERSGATLDALDGTLAEAEVAFARAGALLETDVGPALADIRAAVTSVADDVPAIASDLRALIARADAVVADVQRAVDTTTPGLAQLAPLGQEARAVVRSLNDLVRRIERDPARFLLDDRVPEYRR